MALGPDLDLEPVATDGLGRCFREPYGASRLDCHCLAEGMRANKETMIGR